MPEEETTPVKRTRAPRKRAASSDAPAPRAPRRTAAKKATTSTRKPKAEVEIDEPQVEVTPAKRKAPTPIATERSEQKNKRKQLIIASVVMLFGIGASAAVGFSDAGRIDVNKTIEARNDRITSSSENPTGEVVVPVQNTSGQPNGGMRGRGVGTRNVVPPPSTDAASSTNEAASSTDSEAEGADAVGESPSESEIASDAPIE